MALFKEEPGGRFQILEQTAFGELEKKLEDWIEANPSILFDGQPLAVIARQPRNVHGKFLDLLAFDRRGDTVIIELKRGEAPREVLAQALEYAAWVDSLSFEQLDAIARGYASIRGVGDLGLKEMYARTFDVAEDSDAEGDASVVSFNTRQRIVVVAESFTSEGEQTARYFRSRLGVDITAVQFNVHRAGGETILETTTVVGREPLQSAKSPEPMSPDDDSIRDQHVKTDFMRAAVGVFDRWAASLEEPGLTVEKPGWARRVRFRGDELIYFEYRTRWIWLWLNNATADECARAKAELSEPDKISERPHGFWCRIQTDGDVELIKTFLVERLVAGPRP
ncbi:MAG: hypothetical protein AB7T37_17070 [Dehalococcoidia bacterium]